MLENYLKRIGYTDKVDVSLACLNNVVALQQDNIPFENIDVLLKRAISIEDDKVVEQLVENNRGGYCYQVNGLLAQALSQIGFDVSIIAARPLFGYQGQLRPQTHMLLLVNIKGQQYIVDSGFGGVGIYQSIPLIADVIYQQLDEEFILVADESEFGEYILKSRIQNSESFNELFSFTLSPVPMIDFQLANFFNSNSKDSRFTQTLVLAKPIKEGRLSITIDGLKTRSNTEVSIEPINSKQDLQRSLALFNLGLTTVELDGLWEFYEQAK